MLKKESIHLEKQMFERVPLESTFLKLNLTKQTHIHFLGNDAEASLFIRVDSLEKYEKSSIAYWFELFQTENAPIILFHIQLESHLFSFVYNVKEAGDWDELNDMIEQEEVIVHFVEFEEDELYFGYTFILEFSQNFTEELKRIILQAKEFIRKMVDSFDFLRALTLFEKKEAIFKLKTQKMDKSSLFLPQYQDEDDSVEDVIIKEDKKITDIAQEESENFVIKTYKRDEYESMKEKTVQPTDKKIKTLEDKIAVLESVIREKSKENSKLRDENKYLKEELEYLRLDKGKKGWWPFKKEEEK